MEDRLHRTDFDSVDEYVTFVLEEVLANVEAADDVDGRSFDDADEAEIQKRLESLGYLDE